MMATAEHTIISQAFFKAVDKALQRMGLDEAIVPYGSATIDVGGGKKQADMVWGPRRPPRDYRKRPTVILEVAVSETQAKLRRDMNLWLDPTRGEAKVAISIKINRRSPMISIDKWTWDDINGRVLNYQHIEVSESDTDEVKFSGGPLIIPFHLLFLRQPQEARESYVAIDQGSLQKIDKLEWDMHFKDLMIDFHCRCLQRLQHSRAQ
jgi:hypothetical protein